MNSDLLESKCHVLSDCSRYISHSGWEEMGEECPFCYESKTSCRHPQQISSYFSLVRIVLYDPIAWSPYVPVSHPSSCKEGWKSKCLAFSSYRVENDKRIGVGNDSLVNELVADFFFSTVFMAHSSFR